MSKEFEHKVKVICCDVPQYIDLMRDFTLNEKSIKGFEQLHEFKNVQLMATPGQLHLQPKLIHVIYYKIPAKVNIVDVRLALPPMIPHV